MPANIKDFNLEPVMKECLEFRTGLSNLSYLVCAAEERVDTAVILNILTKGISIDPWCFFGTTLIGIGENSRLNRLVPKQQGRVRLISK